MTTEVKANPPPALSVIITTLLALLSLSAAVATAHAQESDFYDAGASPSYYTADDADAGFFDFGDGATRADDTLLEADDDWFEFDAEYGQSYDQQLVSDETEYQSDDNAFETDETWFEDWISD